MAKTKNFAEAIRRKLAANPELADAVEEEAFNASIASQLWELRREAGLTQKQLAERAGTHQPVIARMEDADYDGHSLPMLRKIAKALKKRLRVEFCSCFELTDAAKSSTFEYNWSDLGWNPQIAEPSIEVNEASAP